MVESAELFFHEKSRLYKAIRRTVGYFRDTQKPDGHWVAELEGDSRLQSETILLLAFLQEENSDLARSCALRLEKTLLPEGGWESYPGSGADITNSVKGYFALKIMGRLPSSEPMRRTRDQIFSLGGIERAKSSARFFLALLGQISYDQTPMIPPQLIFLPRWFPTAIERMSAWSRAIFVPLSMVSALQPVRELPPEKGIRELIPTDLKKWSFPTASGRKGVRLWESLFDRLNRLVRFLRRCHLTPMRKSAIQKAKVWTVRHFRKSDGPGAIQISILWSWIAFKALGLADDSPEVLACRHEFENLVLPLGDDSVRVAPSRTPVCDTVLTSQALLLAGVSPQDPMILRAQEWIMDHQTSEYGDWLARAKTEPGGWALEYHNEFFPDCGNTAMALMVLAGAFPEGKTNRLWTDSLNGENAKDYGAGRQNSLRLIDSVASGRRWLQGLQNRDGGWGSFDRENPSWFFLHLPLVDRDVMADHSTPDMTGRVLESFARQGYQWKTGVRFIDRAVRYLRRRQRPDGSWFGRWGVNYLYGTWQVLSGLAAIGVPLEDEMIQKGANWLLSVQQPSGGWGETPESYQDETLKGKGKETPTQTSWALMGLIAAGKSDLPAVQKGIDFLLQRQKEDGQWREDEFTGTGLPKEFYLKYHAYRLYYPLMTLAHYAARRATQEFSKES